MSQNSRELPRISRSCSKKQFCTIPSHDWRRLDVYCNQCSEKICNKCITTKHDGHDVLSMERRILLETENHQQTNQFHCQQNEKQRYQKQQEAGTKFDSTSLRVDRTAQSAILDMGTNASSQYAKLQNSSDGITDYSLRRFSYSSLRMNNTDVFDDIDDKNNRLTFESYQNSYDEDMGSKDSTKYAKTHSDITDCRPERLTCLNMKGRGTCIFKVMDDKNNTVTYENYQKSLDEDILSRIDSSCEDLKSEYKEIINIWPGYKPENRNEIILVAHLSKDRNRIPSSWNGFPIYKREENAVSNEAKLVANKIVSNREYCISNEQRKELKTVIKEKGAILLEKHKNITIISVSPLRSRHGGSTLTKELCIVIYCHIKGIIPLCENPFPKYIDKFAVDVREAYFSFGGLRNEDLQTSDEVHSPLRIGAEISVQNVKKTGTLGFFVDLDNGQTGFVTCAHLVVKEENLTPNLDKHYDYEDVRVYQPGIEEHNNIVGRLQRAFFFCGDRLETSIDAALVTITNYSRLPRDGYMIKTEEPKLRFAGFCNASPPYFSSGIAIPEPRTIVIKCGASTSITTGVLCGDGVMVRHENIPMSFQLHSGRRFEMYNQYDILSIANQRFFDIGDSGALVMQKQIDGLVGIGMAIGQTSYGSCIATPLGSILEKLNAPLKKFVSQHAKKRRMDTTVINLDYVSDPQGFAEKIGTIRFLEMFQNIDPKALEYLLVESKKRKEVEEKKYVDLEEREGKGAVLKDRLDEEHKTSSTSTLALGETSQDAGTIQNVEDRLKVQAEKPRASNSPYSLKAGYDSGVRRKSVSKQSTNDKKNKTKNTADNDRHNTASRGHSTTFWNELNDPGNQTCAGRPEKPDQFQRGIMFNKGSLTDLDPVLDRFQNLNIDGNMSKEDNREQDIHSSTENNTKNDDSFQTQNSIVYNITTQEGIHIQGTQFARIKIAGTTIEMGKTDSDNDLTESDHGAKSSS